MAYENGCAIGCTSGLGALKRSTKVRAVPTSATVIVENQTGRTVQLTLYEKDRGFFEYGVVLHGRQHVFRNLVPGAYSLSYNRLGASMGVQGVRAVDAVTRVVIRG